MAIQGNYKTLAIPDLFNFICSRKLSGMLVIASREEDRSFFFRNGEVVYALANEPGELLGEILTRELGIDPAIIDEVSRGDGTRFLGEALVERGIISQKSLSAIAERQIRLILRQILRWKEWAFHFERLTMSRSAPPLQLSTQSLIFDLSRELDEWESLNKLLPDLDFVPTTTVDAAATLAIEGWTDELPPVSELLGTINGEHSLRRLLQESPHPVRLHAQALKLAIDARVVQLDPPLDGPFGPPLRTSYFMVPVIPNLSARVLALESRDEDALGVLFNLIQCDPVLTARVLRLVSLRLSHAHEHFSLRTSMARIGVQPLKAILFADAVRNLFLVPSSVTWQQIWEQAYTSSVACRFIAELSRFPEVDLAQACGLLHDIGCILLAGEDRRAYQQVYEYARTTGENLLAAETSIFQTNHCMVGADLARRWGFPPAVATAIREHHSPINMYPDNMLLNIVRLANHMVAPGGAETQLSRSDLKRLTKQLGLEAADLERVRERIEEWGYCLHTSGVLAEGH